MKAVFAVFSRYGDAVTAFSEIREYLKLNKGVKPYVITSPQMSPYAREILPSAYTMSFNKRNIFHKLKLCAFFKKNSFDLGFNPNSFCGESERIIKHAENFFLFKEFSKKYFKDNENKTDALKKNIYNMLKIYFGLKPQEEYAFNPPLNFKARKILICPESSELRKSIAPYNLLETIKIIKDVNPSCGITVACSKEYRVKILNNSQINRIFIFKKKEKESFVFLNLIKDSGLIITADAGPMHIAHALNKKTVSFFSATNPCLVTNPEVKAVYLYNEKLRGVHCENKTCADPVCISLKNASISDYNFNRRGGNIKFPRDCFFKNG